MRDRHYKFKREVDASNFSRALSQKIDAYFKEKGISRRANAMMVTKTLLGLGLWAGSYLYLINADLSTAGVIAVYVLHGYAQLHMGLNIGHDAVHGAYVRSRRLNRVLGCAFDLVGLSSYMWRLMHNDAHHFFVNVRGADTALVSGNLFRFTPHDPQRFHHRFQHIYAPFFYSLATLDWVLAKDYRWLFATKRFGNRRIDRHPRGEMILLFAGKAFYYAYMLVIPLLYLQVPWYAVILGFVVMHLCLGLTLALTFQPNHFTDGSSFPESDENGSIANDSIKHIFDTTVDYARANPLVQWALGGLNLHVIHHMFPGICHVHYPALTRIVKATAEEHGFCYRENKTIAGAFLAHLRWLKMLGTSQVEVPQDVPVTSSEPSIPADAKSVS